MHIPRIYHPSSMTIDTEIIFNKNISHYLFKVLRINSGEKIELFNDTNQVFIAYIIQANHKQVKVLLKEQHENNRESLLILHLGQVVPCHIKKMELIIQKSTELGVHTITPLIPEKNIFKFKISKLDKRIAHWKQIAIHACEQCGRNRIPIIRSAISLKDWCQENHQATKICFDPVSSYGVNEFFISKNKIRLLIGSEKGFSVQEKNFIIKNNFTNMLLGPRILRTETAAIVAVSILQMRFGDLGLNKNSY